MAKHWCATAFLIAMCSLESSLFAQNTNSGDIRGAVTDPLGAVIPGVTVTEKDVDKDVVKTFTTNGAGLYDTGPIVSDHYLITFTQEGFTTFERSPLTLGRFHSDDQWTTEGRLDDRERGGGNRSAIAHHRVRCAGGNAGLRDHGATAPDQSWSGLGDRHRAAARLRRRSRERQQRLQPGAKVAAIYGNLPFDSMLADGATTTLPMSQNSDVTVFETTSEVKIRTNGFSAEYGQGGIIFNQITKGGTSQFHGAGYEYHHKCCGAHARS